MDPLKQVIWIASSKKDLTAFPPTVKKAVGHALWEAQLGQVPARAKVLRGFSGSSVLEIRVEHEGNAYRVVYTVRFDGFVYVLHAFQKKSKRGIKTPANILMLVRKRLKTAEQDYEEEKPP